MPERDDDVTIVSAGKGAADALVAAEKLAEEMERDESVVFFGEDVALPGGVFMVTPGLQERFGEERATEYAP